MSGRIGFGAYELDLVDRVLRNGTQPVRLSARQVDLLAMLVQREGEVVSKDELLTGVWPGQNVEENNVAVHVSGLRRLLGRDAIDTVAGRGYRFALPVQVEPAPACAPPAAVAAPTGFRPRDLPRVPQPMHGRADDLQALLARVAEHRLVTVTGSPGLGKSTLALACAHDARQRLRDGAVWVGLGRDEGPTNVLAAVAAALGLDTAAEPSTVLDLLREREALLVIDNAEVDAGEVAAFAHAVLESTERVALLVTSRKVLRVSGERVFRPPPLSVPAPGADWREALAHGAVALFVDQARAQDQHFELGPHNAGPVIDICRRLDGLPHAIQLAAGRLPMFGVDHLCECLGDRFRLLTRGMSAGLPRHRSLRASMDLSHALLNDTERRVFRRLASFEAGFTLEQAIGMLADDQLEAWGIADALEGLVDQSLVLVDPGEPPRYHLLESTRAYAQRLQEESGELDTGHDRHAEAVRSLFELASRVLKVQPDARCLEQFAPEISDLREALDRYLVDAPAAGVQVQGFSRDLFELLSLTLGAQGPPGALASGVPANLAFAAAAKR
ncbi:winged helix-turn-helix domain-containing protein [Ideonella sp.]|uniref:ATP-binding protein n=1 Tax=Ideonella sp. TaxID=1929293 RepID=UPI0035B45A4F